MAPSLQEKMENMKGNLANMKDDIRSKVDSKMMKITGSPSSRTTSASPTSTSTHSTHSAHTSDDAARKTSSTSTSSAPTSTITRSATGPNRSSSSSSSSSKPLASLIAAAKNATGPVNYSSSSNVTNVNNTKISNVNETEVHIVNNYYTMEQPDGKMVTKTVPRLVTSTRSVKTTQTVTAPPITVTMSLGGGLRTFTLTSHAAYPTGGAHVGGLHFGSHRKGALDNDSDLLAAADPGAAKGLGSDAVASANSVMRVAASSAGWGAAPTGAASKSKSIAALWGLGDDDDDDADDKDDKKDSSSSPTPAATASSSSASATATTSCGDSDINCLLAQLTASSTSTSSSSSAKATGPSKAGHETKKLMTTSAHSNSSLSIGFIIAIVAVALGLLLVIFGLILACRRSASRKRKNDNEWRRTPPQMTQQPASSVPYAYGGVGNSAQPPANYRTMSRTSLEQGPSQAPAISINVNGGGDPFHDRNAMGHARSGSSASRQTVPPIDESSYYRGPAVRNEANAGAPRWPDASRNQAPPAPGSQPSLRSLPYKTSTPQPLAPSPTPSALPTLAVPLGGVGSSSLAPPHSRTSLPSFYSTASATDRLDGQHPVPKIPQSYNSSHDLA